MTFKTSSTTVLSHNKNFISNTGQISGNNRYVDSVDWYKKNVYTFIFC